VTDCNKISVFPVDGVERQGHMLAIDTALDIAIVSASGPYLGHHLVELDTHARSGDQLYALGYGISPTNPYHPTYLTGTLKGENTLDNGNRVLVVQAPIPAGTSGAALVDPQARLVGAIIGHYATAPNLGVVIPAQSIRAFAMQYGFMMAPVRPGDRPATARDDVLLNVSALVQCNAR
jgi:S1-C subfamily serine protease